MRPPTILSATYVPTIKSSTFYFLLALFFLNSPQALFAQWTQLGLDIDGEAAVDLSGQSVSMPDANTVAIGALANDDNGIAAGHVRIYEWSGTTWVQKGIDIDGESAGDFSGFSVSMPDSNTLAVGAYSNDGNGLDAGHVKVYRWNGSSWVQKGNDIDGEAPGDRSGWAVSMPNSDMVAVGATWNQGNGLRSGHVRIYKWNGVAWVQRGTDIDGEAAGDESGYDVSMPDSNTVAIGARLNDGTASLSGHVRVYRWDGAAWIQKGGDIDGEAFGDYFGTSVSMADSNTLAAGANGNNGVNSGNVGHVRVFGWNGSSWLQKGMDIDGEANFDESGISVDLYDKNHLAIGARLNDGNGNKSGHTRIYRWDGTTWRQKGLDIDGEFLEDESGGSVSMPDSNTVAIGATLNDGGGNSSGHVRVFKFGNITSIKETKNISAFSIYPNPSNGELSIELIEYTNMPLQILDLSGKLIQEFQLNKSRNNLDLTGLADGIYFIRYGVITKKLVITR